MTGTGKASSVIAPVLAVLRDSVIVILTALLASTLLRVFVAQMFVIPSGSMENTLRIDDRVIVQKLASYQRGDVIVFRDGLGWLGTSKDPAQGWQQMLVFVGLAPDLSTNHLIKRLIGLPGDHVTCCDARGRVSINGIPLDETAYLYTDPSGRQIVPSEWAFDVVVPAGKVFVMGDHRNNSQDSRCHLDDRPEGQPVGATAFIDQKQVVGSAVALVYPFYRWRVLSVPSTFASIPNPTSSPPADAIITGSRVVC